jgi:hypothetical protein
MKAASHSQTSSTLHSIGQSPPGSLRRSLAGLMTKLTVMLDLGKMTQKPFICKSFQSSYQAASGRRPPWPAGAPGPAWPRQWGPTRKRPRLGVGLGPWP